MPNRTAVASAALALGLVAAQVAVIRLAGSGLAVRIVLPLTVAAVPFALWPHRRHAGVWVMYVGLAANLVAMLTNGGLMPIRRETVVAAVGEERALAYRTGAWMAGSKDVLLASGDGRAVALGDQVIIPLGRGGLVASPGDLVVWSGIAILAGELSWGWQRRRRARQETEQRQRIVTRARGERAEGGAATVP